MPLSFPALYQDINEGLYWVLNQFIVFYILLMAQIVWINGLKLSLDALIFFFGFVFFYENGRYKL